MIDTKNQHRLMQYNARRIQYMLAMQKLAWLAQAGSHAEYARRINSAYCASGFKQA